MITYPQTNRLANGWQPAPYFPSMAGPHRTRRIGRLGQNEAGAVPLDPSNDDNRMFLIANGTAVGYTVLASLIYGKNKTMDRVLLGVGGGFYALAALSGLNIALSGRPENRNSWDRVIAGLFGVLDSVVVAGAIGATINPKLISRTSMSDSIAKGIPAI